jgi:hypothetical protein
MVRYLAEYLGSLGFSAEESHQEEGGRNTSRLKYTLTRVNPSVPGSLERLELRVVSTGGGCLVFWDSPRSLDRGVDMVRPKRFVEEICSHLERAISTGSRGVAKVRRERPDTLPFEG